MDVRMTAGGLATGAAMLLLLLVPGTLLFMYSAQAQTTVRNMDRAAPFDVSAQTRKRRPRVRIYREDERGVYPSYNPGADAVRDCTAHYVQEFRPSGTVIVPRMNCYWRHG
ncbi:hypothetical protein NB311A_15967 [Nitrobacter sp. Nb-311A]|uniref:hypothetical protein n=1 Tax=unclassified Nitrobacter TaxID=2620411 RepID=UPI0000685FCD|nr:MULTISPECIES: hypothetical protein [unclassified Nitrobacter]EAQ36779.1 hypothetical protein NB311A_15967 [Nitrobacter sp. Nb-311A]MCB1392778.1 hypothetical protein [Nitrobacter sp.]MCV0385464.1 hypothetical protein [Nitrobacter sp.]